MSRTFLVAVDDAGKDDINRDIENNTEQEGDILITGRESEKLVLILNINNIWSLESVCYTIELLYFLFVYLV